MTDIFDNKYYKAMKFLTSIVGRWPYQTVRDRYIFATLVIFPCVIQFIGEVHAVILFNDDQELLLESFAPFAIDASCTLKYMCNVLNWDKVKRLCAQIKSDWKFYNNESEQKILHEYAALGQLYSYIYIVAAYSTAMVFIVEPLIPRWYSKLINSNATVPLRYPVPIYWVGVDMEDDYVYTISFTSHAIICILTVEIALDVFFIVLLQHVAGLFAVTGHMMANIPTKSIIKNKELSNKNISLYDLQHQYYARCIESHKSAIRFTGDLEDIYVWCFGVLVLLNIPVMSVTAIQVTTQAKNIEQTMKYSMFAVCQVCHVLVLCYCSQQIITNSLDIQQNICNGLWYKCDIRLQKLLTLVTLRSQHECKLTAGKTIVLSIETFTVLVKTAVSYFTVLGSMR